MKPEPAVRFLAETAGYFLGYFIIICLIIGCFIAAMGIISFLLQKAIKVFRRLLNQH